MAAKSTPLFFAVTLVYSTVLGTGPANASCSDRDRPATPDAVMGEARTMTVIASASALPPPPTTSAQEKALRAGESLAIKPASHRKASDQLPEGLILILSD